MQRRFEETIIFDTDKNAEYFILSPVKIIERKYDDKEKLFYARGDISDDEGETIVFSASGSDRIHFAMLFKDDMHLSVETLIQMAAYFENICAVLEYLDKGGDSTDADKIEKLLFREKKSKKSKK